VCSPDPQYAIEGQLHDYWYTYDAAGRQIGQVSTDNSCSPSTGNQTQYDAENHIELISHNSLEFAFLPSSAAAASGTIEYGPDARYRVDTWSGNPSNGTDSVHWDGDTLLFMSPGNSIDYLYLGKLGYMDSTGQIWISDRDQTGAELTHHAGNISGSGAWFPGLSLGNVRTVYTKGGSYSIYVSVGSCNFNNGTHQYPCPLFAPWYPMTRSDGYLMVGGIVQGARTYDPTSGQWLTPDAYAGDVNSPMSQKPFLWNGNNGVKYSDPSGYDSTSQGLDGSGATNQNQQPLLTDSSLTGEVATSFATKYFTSEDAQHAIEGGYAAALGTLGRNLDPKNYSDQSLLANNVRDAFTKSKLGTWSLTDNYLTATLSGHKNDVSFVLTVLVGMVHLSMMQGGIMNLAEEEFMRYAKLPGKDWDVQARHPFGGYGWLPTDISPLKLIQNELPP
jgi:hypothetical protein